MTRALLWARGHFGSEAIAVAAALDASYPRKREVRSKYELVRGRQPLQILAALANALLLIAIVVDGPVGFGKRNDGAVRQVADVQQLVAIGSNLVANVSGRVTVECDRCDAGQQGAAGLERVDLRLDCRRRGTSVILTLHVGPLVHRHANRGLRERRSTLLVHE